MQNFLGKANCIKGKVEDSDARVDERLDRLPWRSFVSPLFFSLVLIVLYALIYAHKILRALLLLSPTILTIAQ